MRLTGRQTIYQMIQLAEEVRRRGGQPLDPLAYKHRYHDLLMRRIEGQAPPDIPPYVMQGWILDATPELTIGTVTAGGHA